MLAFCVFIDADCSSASPIFGHVHSCAATTPSSGTPNNFTYTCAVTIPRYSEGGLWSATMGASDAVGNEMQFQSPTPLNVACDATGGGEADIRFQPDEQTLVWDAVTGAVSYNHYRGAVSSLTDLDFDGLADSGYGECRNSTDPDTTDTQFVDATVPGARTGLFYLVAWVDGVGAEQGLGRSNTGLDRFPTVPCP